MEAFAEVRADKGQSGCDTSRRPSVNAPHSIADLGWSGTTAIDINIPAHVEYRPSAKAEASVSGYADLVSHARLIDGRLVWDREDYRPCIAPGDLVVHIAGPAVATWAIHGIGQLNLNNVSQDTLEITMDGAGSISANGDVKEIILRAMGAGRTDLSRLETQHASVHIYGSGKIDLAPHEDADISISGSALVKVHGNQAKLHVRSHGSAQVIQVPTP